MYELEGLFCNTALSGINWKFAGQEKNTIGQNLQASPIGGKKGGALGSAHPVVLGPFQCRSGPAREAAVAQAGSGSTRALACSPPRVNAGHAWLVLKAEEAGTRRCRWSLAMGTACRRMEVGGGS